MTEANKSKQTTHFGFQQVGLKEKVEKVNQVFSSVATKYDLMNDAMSLGTHRLWKRTFISMASVRAGDKLLDLASGSGDIALGLAKKYPHYGELTVSDINQDMLDLAKKNLINNGVLRGVKFSIANAEELPFRDNYFNSIFMSFGLRNVADKQKALSSIFNKLSPGGQFLALEFSRPQSKALSKLYDEYSFRIIPKIGKFIAKDEDSYQYLVESIRMHPNQDDLAKMFEDAGFINCHYHNLSMGIVAIHKGIKP